MIRARLLLVPVLAFLVFTVAPASTATALSGSDFQAGRIIDDQIFFDGAGMTQGQVQLFLNAKVPTCNTNHPKSGSVNDSGPPYTCLKDYRQDTFNIAADAYCRGFSGGNKSAAQIIYEVGQSCGINQKVILVTLQKEQSLITDDWPWTRQYTKATGFGCPDTALPADVDANQNGCYDEYEGFFKQVYYGARQFKRYAQDPQIFTSYRQYKTSFIKYHPDSNCEGANVYIANQATSGLYTYTPYQPNSAALNDLYGSGDIADPAWPNCSSFGNRNFWRMFSDWFGPTLVRQTYPNDPASSWPNGTSDTLVRTSNGSAWSKSYDGLTGGWKPWRSVAGATLGSDPVVMNQENDRLDVFAAGPAGDLIHTWSEFGLWQSWESLGWIASGVNIVGTPAAVSWSNGRIDVFVRGSDGFLWQKWYDASFGGWQPWAKHPVTISSSPTVNSWGKGRLDVSFASPSGDLQHYFYSNGWKNGGLLGQPNQSVTVSGTPAAVSWSNGRIDVFVRGSDGFLWQKWYDASFGGWQPWAKHPVTISSSPTVNSWGKGRLDVFTKNTSTGDLYHYWYGYGYGWAGSLTSLGKP